jgi:hypothetical protein
MSSGGWFAIETGPKKRPPTTRLGKAPRFNGKDGSTPVRKGFRETKKKKK